MLSLAIFFLVGLGGILSLPIALLLVEIVAAVAAPAEASFERAGRPDGKKIAIVIPAHNESSGLLPTLKDVLPQLEDEDRLYVVADNCNDDTAEVAASAGASVLVRNDPDLIGKGYALAWAISCLRADPPDFVAFVDADCRVEPNFFARLAAVCAHLKRPVQSAFLMKAPTGASNHSFSEFAWIIRNWARPLGLRRLNGPVQLMGSGMMFPWKVVETAPLAGGNLVEDLRLGLDLASTGAPAYFFPFATVTSQFPSSEKGTRSQRLRWIQGHIQTILSAPRLSLHALRSGNMALLILALDLAIPPLSLLGMLTIAYFAVTACFLIASGASGPFILSIVNVSGMLLAVWLAFAKFGRPRLPDLSVGSALKVVIGRLRLYGSMLVGRTARQWVRTDRT